MSHAGAQPKDRAVYGAEPPMWIICGNLNTALAYLQFWERDSEKYKDQVLIHQALTINRDNKSGDYMLSQGFVTTHVGSTIGCSERSRKHASDAHNMVTLFGRKAPLQNAGQPENQKDPPAAARRPHRHQL